MIRTINFKHHPGQIQIILFLLILAGAEDSQSLSDNSRPTRRGATAPS